MASPCAGAPALKYGDVNTVTPSPGEVKRLNDFNKDESKINLNNEKSENEAKGKGKGMALTSNNKNNKEKSNNIKEVNINKLRIKVNFYKQFSI